MFPNHQTNGLPPDRGPAPAYRLAPDTPAAIADDLAHLCASAGSFSTSNTAEGLSREPAAAASAYPSRRLALFGAAAALLAPPLAHPAAARVPEADAELARLADEIDRTLDGAAYALEPVADRDDQDRRLDHADTLMADMVALPAIGLAGVKAKAKAYLDLWSYDLDTADLSRSLAEDAERVCFEVLA